MSFFPADNLVSKVLNAPIEDQYADDYFDQIKACTTVDDLGVLSQKIIADDRLDINQQEQLVNLIKDRASELSPTIVDTDEQQISTTTQPSLIDEIENQATKVVQDKICKDAMSGNGQSSYSIDTLTAKTKEMLINRIYDMDSVEALERLAPAIPASKLSPADQQELLQIYAERKHAMQQADA